MASDAPDPGVPTAPGETPPTVRGGRVVAAPRTALEAREALAERGLAVTAALGLDLPPEARALLRDPRPLGWGHLLFAAVLDTGVQAAAELRGRAFTVVPEPTGERVAREEFGTWYQQRLGDGGGETGFLARLSAAVNEQLPHALRPDGVPADPGDLAAAARQVAGVYRDLLEWKWRVRGAAVPPPYRVVQSVLQEGMDFVIGSIPTLADDLRTAVRTATDRHAAGLSLEPMHVTLAGSLPHGWTDRLAAAYATARAVAAP